MSVTTVIVTYRAAAMIDACVRSALAADAGPVLVIDNASDDGTAAVLRSLAETTSGLEVVRTDKNLGFAGGVDFALSWLADHEPRPEYVALLNDDAIAEPDWLAVPLARLAADPQLAAVTSKILLQSSGAMNNAGVALTGTGYGYDVGFGAPPTEFEDAREVFGFCGAAAVLRRGAVDQAGGFPSDFFLYYEDTDTSFRLRLAGHRIVFEPASIVRHAHSATTDQRSRLFAFHNERNRLAMLVRCAPAPAAIRAFVRFAVTTASLGIKTLLHRRPPEANFDPRLRLAVLGSLLGRLPALIRARRATGATRVTRARVWSDWAGRSDAR